MRGRKCLTGLAVGATLASTPAHADLRAPGLVPAPNTPEAGLWELTDKAEQHAKHSAELDRDPALNAYVREVACEVAPEYCKELRVYVMDRPFVNAQMAPNGYAEVWSGLLLRSQDEASLAFVLGHEVSHFAENHSIEALEAQKNRANVALAISAGVAVAGVAAAASAGPYGNPQAVLDATRNLVDAVYLGSIAAFFRFSRAQEAEADFLGIRRMAAAGYDPKAAAETWRDIMSETAASDFDKIRKSDARLGIFDSHPLNSERAKALDAEAAKLPSGGRTERLRYRQIIRPHLAAWLKDDLRRRDFGETLHVLDRLAGDGEDLGVINFYRGEAYRLRRQDGDLDRAEIAYAAASTQPDAPVAVWRELGDLRKRKADLAGARSAYEAYLAKAPTAEDSWLVQDSLQSLSKGNL
jgi:predicted Zn-dependent protease